MKNYKRSPIDREVTYKAPYYECHACNDTGIIHNADGLINHHLPDYDIDDSGKRCGGQDLALICWCSAANATYDQDNQLVCKGYRELDNTIRNNVGVNLDKCNHQEIFYGIFLIFLIFLVMQICKFS